MPALAIGVVLFSTFLHAWWNVLAKGAGGPRPTVFLNAGLVLAIPGVLVVAITEVIACFLELLTSVCVGVLWLDAAKKAFKAFTSLVSTLGLGSKTLQPVAGSILHHLRDSFTFS